MENQLSENKKNEILDAIYKGKKLEAIKIYKLETGKDLREAKEYIEGLTNEIRKEYPEKFQNNLSGNGGCMKPAIFLFGIIGTLAFYLFKNY